MKDDNMKSQTQQEWEESYHHSPRFDPLLDYVILNPNLEAVKFLEAVEGFMTGFGSAYETGDLVPDGQFVSPVPDVKVSLPAGWYARRYDFQHEGWQAITYWQDGRLHSLRLENPRECHDMWRRAGPIVVTVAIGLLGRFIIGEERKALPWVEEEEDYEDDED